MIHATTIFALKGHNILKQDSVLSANSKILCALKGYNFLKQDIVLYTKPKIISALKGQYIIKQDSVLFANPNVNLKALKGRNKIESCHSFE